MSSKLMGHWNGDEAAVVSNGEGDGIGTGIGVVVYAGWRLLKE